MQVACEWRSSSPNLSVFVLFSYFPGRRPPPLTPPQINNGAGILLFFSPPPSIYDALPPRERRLTI